MPKVINMAKSRQFTNTLALAPIDDLKQMSSFNLELEQLEQLIEYGYPEALLNQYVLSNSAYKKIMALILNYHDFLNKKFTHEQIIKIGTAKDGKNLTTLCTHYHKLEILKFSKTQIAKIAAHNYGAQMMRSIIELFPTYESINKTDYLVFLNAKTSSSRKRKFQYALDCIELLELQREYNKKFAFERRFIGPYGVIKTSFRPTNISNPAFSFFQPSTSHQSVISTPLSANHMGTKISSDLIEKMRLVMMDARRGDNTLNNCGYLALYAMKCMQYILDNKEFIHTPASTQDSRLNTFDYAYFRNIPIINEKLLNDLKKEDENSQKFKTKEGIDAVYAIRSTEGIHAFLPPNKVHYTNIGSPKIDSVEIDPNEKYVLRNSIFISHLNQKLKQTASELNAVIIGDIKLVPISKHETSHTVAFCADKNQVFFVDGQFYNGITEQGDPIIFDLASHYAFESSPAHKAYFHDKVFYLVYKTLEIEINQAHSHKAQRPY